MIRGPLFVWWLHVTVSFQPSKIAHKIDALLGVGNVPSLKFKAICFAGRVLVSILLFYLPLFLLRARFHLILKYLYFCCLAPIFSSAFVMLLFRPMLFVEISP